MNGIGAIANGIITGTAHFFQFQLTSWLWEKNVSRKTFKQTIWTSFPKVSRPFKAAEDLSDTAHKTIVEVHQNFVEAAAEVEG